MSEKNIQVLVVDDHETIRKSIKAMLIREPDIEVVGLAVNGHEAVQMVQTTRPDVVVMDVSMPELDGIRAAGQIQILDISTRIIMLSMHHNSTLVEQARLNGAVGYIMKQQAVRDLVPAIRAAYRGTLSF